MIYFIVTALVLICIGLTGWSFFLYTRLGKAEDKAGHYYETVEWRSGMDGTHFAQDDESMDTLLYLPHRKIVCFFQQRKIAPVLPNGSFTINAIDGIRLKGNVHPFDNYIELTDGKEAGMKMKLNK